MSTLLSVHQTTMGIISKSWDREAIEVHDDPHCQDY